MDTGLSKQFAETRMMSQIKSFNVVYNISQNTLSLKPIQSSRVFCLHLLADAMFKFILNEYLTISMALKNRQIMINV